MTKWTAETTARQGRHRRRREGPGSKLSRKNIEKIGENSEEKPSDEAGEKSGNETWRESEKYSDPEGDEGRKVAMLRKIWTIGAGEVYYDKLRAGGETYSCGECAMMDPESGRRWVVAVVGVSVFVFASVVTEQRRICYLLSIVGVVLVLLLVLLWYGCYC